MDRRVIVKNEFADKNQFSKRYSVGEELVDFDEARIQDLVERGLVVIEGGEDQSQETESNESIDLSKSAKDILGLIKDIDDVEALNVALRAESESEKPRSTVVEALTERISQLTEDE